MKELVVSRGLQGGPGKKNLASPKKKGHERGSENESGVPKRKESLRGEAGKAQLRGLYIKNKNLQRHSGGGGAYTRKDGRLLSEAGKRKGDSGQA